jgi:TP901 family phage tail tape measure protein
MVDKISGKLDGISSKTDSFGKQMFKANVATKALEMGLGAAQQAMTAFVGLTSQAISVAADFEFNMRKIANVADLTNTQMDAMGGTIRDAAMNSMFSIEEMQQSFYDLGAAGTFGADAMTTIMEQVTLLATATGSELTNATMVTTKVLNAFQLNAGDAAEVVDVLTMAANASALELEDMTTALSYAGPIATAAGMSLSETTAIIAELSNMGFDASQAGTALRQAMIKIGEPTAEGAARLEELGVAFFNTSGDFRGFEAILPELTTSMAGLSEEQRLLAAKQIFGARAGTGMLALMAAEMNSAGELTGAYAAMLDQIERKGVAQEQANAIENTALFQIEKMKTQLSGMVLGFGDAIVQSQGFKEMLSAIGSILSDPAIIGAITKLGEFVGKVLVTAFNALKPAIDALIPIIVTIVDNLDPLLDILTPLIEVIGTLIADALILIAPVIEQMMPVIMNLVDAVATALIPIVQALFPVLETLLPVFISLLPAIDSIANIIRILSPIITGLAKILATGLVIQLMWSMKWLVALVPILELLEKLLIPLEPIIGIIGDGLGVIGDVLLNLVNPAIKVFTDIIEGATSILQDIFGPVVQTIADALDPPQPCLMEAFQNATGAVEEFNDSIDNTASGVRVNVVPALGSMSELGGEVAAGLGGIGGAGGTAGEGQNITISNTFYVEGDLNEGAADQIIQAQGGSQPAIGL